MFIRKTATKNKKTQTKYTTHKLVESYRNKDGEVRQRVIMSLGTIDLPKKRWPELASLLESRITGQLSFLENDEDVSKIADTILKHNEFIKNKVIEENKIEESANIEEIDLNSVSTTYGRSLGPELVANKFWEVLEFEKILKKCHFSQKPDFGVVGEGEYLGSLLSMPWRMERPTPICPVSCAEVEVSGCPSLVKDCQAADTAVGCQVPFLCRTGGHAESPDETRMPLPLHLLHLSPYRGNRLACSRTPPTRSPKRPESCKRWAPDLLITDSVFNSDYTHSLAVANAFRRQGLTIPWGAFFSPTHPPDGYHKALAESGLTHVEFGTETFCNTQLIKYGKPFDREDVVAAQGSAHRAGVQIAHYLLLGGPGEDAQTLEETLNRMEEIEKAVFFIFCGIRIFPHTRLHTLAQEESRSCRVRGSLPAPVFYRSKGIGTEEIIARIRTQARGRMNWVYGDGGEKSERVVSRLHTHGHTGPYGSFSFAEHG